MAVHNHTVCTWFPKKMPVLMENASIDEYSVTFEHDSKGCSISISDIKTCTLVVQNH